MTYINSYKNQDWLLPTSIKQMISVDHICFFVEEFVDSLDFTNFDMIYEGAGHPAYHPRIIMKIIIQGMLSKERSSRKLASACRENFVFMYLAEKVQPNFRTIARFRRNNKGFVKETFKANRDDELFRLYKKYDFILRVKQSGLLDYIYDSCIPEVIILFGSASKGEDIEESDIDLFVQAKDKKINVEKYEKLLNRKISLFFEENFSKLNNELKNNILNGIILRGYIKAF